jgi:hypothetical protein
MEGSLNSITRCFNCYSKNLRGMLASHSHEWHKCVDCGKMLQIRKQEVRGCANGEPCISVFGEIEDGLTFY